MSSYVQEAKRTLGLAGPIIVGQVSQMLMSVTDAVMIGRVGKEALAASAFAGSIWGVFFVMGIGLLIPVAVKVSESHGGGDETQTAEWLKHGVVTGLAAGLLGMGAMLGLRPMLHLFNQPPEVLALVPPYYALIAVSLVPTLGFQVLRQFAESLERPVMPMVFMLVGVVLNVGLNWVFIYGRLGAPAMGLTGAGWATLISRTLGVVAIWWWVSRATHFQAAWPTRWWGGYAWERVRSLLGLGVPISFSLLFESGAFGLAAIMMGWLGATQLAAHQIAISCAAFTFMFPLGLSMAVSMRVSRALGAKRFEALRPIAGSAQVMSGLVMGTFALLFAVGGDWLAAQFVPEREVIVLAASLLVVAAVFQLADGAQVVAAAALRGLSDVVVPTAITALAYWGLALPLGWWLGTRTGWGAQGIWVGLASGLVFAAVALNWRFLRRTRAERLARLVGAGS
ncbi:MATE family efflux transporter [Actomonas aquatica]|uniref:Multidrug-efflux transporter n=1 Tax=Actomonas aquatica TaxID=2866162 RepID=A0ABZ1C3V2_9BACT|nr:MATE family efflux transporter [Opitutus sp. WL0086]WRQ86383.1 MATE family efflux transporter [Opitutus sp. WL0086]